MSVGKVQHLTNEAYGFPRGQRRRVTPVALACIHITGNQRTAAYGDLHAAAQAERDYANRSGSDGPSAHDYVARDGWAIEAIDWQRFAAWSNGDVTSPNTANPGIRRVLALRERGYNANEGYWFEFENVGYGTRYPVISAQKQHCAERIVEAAKHSGLPINRETVHGHWEINGVNRQTCPSPNHEGFLNDVIDRARALAEGDPVVAFYTLGPADGIVTVAPNRGIVSLADLTAVVPPEGERELRATARIALPEPYGGGGEDRQKGYLANFNKQAHIVLDATVAAWVPNQPPAPPEPDCSAAVLAERERIALAEADRIRNT